jgi:hypothetical protein
MNQSFWTLITFAIQSDIPLRIWFVIPQLGIVSWPKSQNAKFAVRTATGNARPSNSDGTRIYCHRGQQKSIAVKRVNVLSQRSSFNQGAQSALVVGKTIKKKS